MCLIVFPIFAGPPETLHEDSIPRQAAKKIRLAKFRALLHQHAPLLLGWTPNDTETSRNDDKSCKTKATLPPYVRDPKTSEEGKLIADLE